MKKPAKKSVQKTVVPKKVNLWALSPGHKTDYAGLIVIALLALGVLGLVAWGYNNQYDNNEVLPLPKQNFIKPVKQLNETSPAQEVPSVVR
jgi:hypothetical protein